MEAPDRIWIDDHGRGFLGIYWYPKPDEAVRQIQYLRATPELLALIEAAKTFAMEMPRKYQGMSEAALAFAKSQNHPDAGGE